jgi:hypothetical protein
MVLNHTKCKELVISFAKDTRNFRPLFLENIEFPGFRQQKSLVLFSRLIFIGTCILNTSWQKHQINYIFSEYLNELEWIL